MAQNVGRVLLSFPDTPFDKSDAIDEESRRGRAASIIEAGMRVIG
jgi:dihydrodipicolinate synthase/N-acetylneuraminate lyase